MCVLLFVLFCTTIICVSSVGLKEEFTWTRLDYVWPTYKSVYKRQIPYGFKYGFSNQNLNYTGSKNNNVSKGQYVFDYRYENNIPMGANVWKNKLFITVPRRRLGVPSTLNYVPLNNRIKHNAPLIPYPDWDTNMYPRNNSNRGENIFSVYRVTVDQCDRLWFVDTGLLESPGNETRVKPITLMVMDLLTDKIIHKYILPQNQLRDISSVATLTVDVTNKTCSDAYAYLPDYVGYGVIVYSLRKNKSWRINHNYFYLESLAGDLSIGGYSMQWNNGVFSIQLSKIKSDGSRDVYFHSMAGTHMFKVSSKILKNDTLITRSYHTPDFKNLGDRGANSQTSIADLHQSTGIMFLGLIAQNALGCWNTQHSFDKVSVVQKDDRKMIYPSDVKIYGDRVYVLTNRMPIFLYGRLNYDDINFSVWTNTVNEALKNTKCSKSKWSLF